MESMESPILFGRLAEECLDVLRDKYELKSLTFSFAAGPRIVAIEIIRFFVWGRAPWGHRASVSKHIFGRTNPNSTLD